MFVSVRPGRYWSATTLSVGMWPPPSDRCHSGRRLSVLCPARLAIPTAAVVLDLPSSFSMAVHFGCRLHLFVVDYFSNGDPNDYDYNEE